MVICVNLRDLPAPPFSIPAIGERLTNSREPATLRRLNKTLRTLHEIQPFSSTNEENGRFYLWFHPWPLSALVAAEGSARSARVCNKAHVWYYN